MRAILLLGLLLLSPPAAADSSAKAEDMVGKVIMLMFDGNWLIRYRDKRYSCQTTSLCHDFREGLYFIPSMEFRRPKELVDYLLQDQSRNDCMLHNCVIY